MVTYRYVGIVINKSGRVIIAAANTTEKNCINVIIGYG